MSASSRLFGALSPPLSPAVLGVLDTLSFKTMTPVQAATIPLFLSNKDVCAEACTGSGKTLAYVIPTVEMLVRVASELKLSDVGAIILSPTRELARQIYQVTSLFMAAVGLKSSLLVGGTDVAADMARCARHGCQVIIATPGRLLDVMQRNEAAHALDFKKLEVLIFDEADTLLDMGFRDALTQILSFLPKQRRTGLFSATQTQEVKALARAGLRNPAIISVKVQHASGGAGAASSSAEAGYSSAEGGGAATAAAAPASKAQSTPLTLSNYYSVSPDAATKLAELCAFLRERAAKGDKVIVFALTCASVDYLGKVLALPAVRAAAGLPPATEFPILPLHGQMAANRRTTTYTAFVSASAGALLCTDVAARGIDVPDVDWIVQYDPPKDPAFFIHRVGRTARAGRVGSALLLLLEAEEPYVNLLALRAVPMSHRPPATTAANAALEEALKQAALNDRDVLEKGTKAFLSFLRGYGEHVCRYIFKPTDLAIPPLAASFGLVKLPKAEELRGKTIDYAGVPGVDTSKIAYADSAREAARQAKLAAEAESAAAARAARDERRARAIAAAEKAAADPRAAKREKRKHKGMQARIFEDWDMLAREERLEKQLEKGKISKKEYKKQMAALHREQGIAASDDDLDDLVSSDSGSDSDGDSDDGSDGDVGESGSGSASGDGGASDDQSDVDEEDLAEAAVPEADEDGGADDHAATSAAASASAGAVGASGGAGGAPTLTGKRRPREASEGGAGAGDDSDDGADSSDGGADEDEEADEDDGGSGAAASGAAAAHRKQQGRARGHGRFQQGQRGAGGEQSRQAGGSGNRGKGKNLRGPTRPPKRNRTADDW